MNYSKYRNEDPRLKALRLEQDRKREEMLKKEREIRDDAERLEASQMRRSEMDKLDAKRAEVHEQIKSEEAGKGQEVNTDDSKSETVSNETKEAGNKALSDKYMKDFENAIKKANKSRKKIIKAKKFL